MAKKIRNSLGPFGISTPAPLSEQLCCLRTCSQKGRVIYRSFRRPGHQLATWHSIFDGKRAQGRGGRWRGVVQGRGGAGPLLARRARIARRNQLRATENELSRYLYHEQPPASAPAVTVSRGTRGARARRMRHARREGKQTCPRHTNNRPPTPPDPDPPAHTLGPPPRATPLPRRGCAPLREARRARQ